MAAEHRKRIWVLHPPALGLFFVLAFYTASMRHFPIRVIWLPVAAVLAGIPGLWALLYLLTRNGRKSGMLTSLVVVMFFGYGYILEPIERSGGIHFAVFGWRASTNTVLFPAWALILLAGLWLVRRRKGSLEAPTRLLNIFAACLVLTSAGTIVIRALRSRPAGEWRREPGSIDPGPPQSLPNVCYIIPDGYGRADVLRDLYGLDTEPFLDYLAGKGFYVAARARANYCQTFLSQASTLNMRYLDELARRLGPDCDDRRPLLDMVHESEVGRLLHQCGYQMVHFDSGYAGTSAFHNSSLIGSGPCLGEFPEALLDHTMIVPILRKISDFRRPRSHRQRIRYALDGIPDALDADRPVFVYAHILSPHPPFVFAADGSPRTPSYRYQLSDGSHIVGRYISAEEYKRQYSAQVQFLAGKLRGLIDRILAKAGRPTIILIQADHGPGMLWDWDDVTRSDARERLGILSAYYFPDGDYSSLRPEITPVNTFRVILNQYLGGRYRLLPDKAYMSTWDRPYDLSEAAEPVPSSTSSLSSRPARGTSR